MKDNTMKLMNKMLIATLFLAPNALYPLPQIEMHENNDNRPPIIPRVVRMQEDDDVPDYITPDVIMACAFCGAVVGSVIGDRCLPPSWDFSEDAASSNAKIGGGLCASAVTWLLLNRSVSRKMNHGCDALARLLHIKSE